MSSDVIGETAKGAGLSLPRREWTVEDVKDRLPDVPVKIGDKVFTGRVGGRLNQHAQVTVTAPIEGTGVDVPITFTYAWGTVCRALNQNGGHLQV